jgi:hypothetical protein
MALLRLGWAAYCLLLPDRCKGEQLWPGTLQVNAKGKKQKAKSNRARRRCRSKRLLSLSRFYFDESAGCGPSAATGNHNLRNCGVRIQIVGNRSAAQRRRRTKLVAADGRKAEGNAARSFCVRSICHLPFAFFLLPSSSVAVLP